MPLHSPAQALLAATPVTGKAKGHFSLFPTQELSGAANYHSCLRREKGAGFDTAAHKGAFPVK